MKTRTKVNGGTYDVVEAAMKMGMERVNATMATPYMWFTPGGSDPYSPVVIMIVEALQQRLRHMGFENRADGFVDRATSAALREISGPTWKQKAWVQVYGDILHTAATGHRPRTTEEDIMSYRHMGAINGRVRYLREAPAGTRWGSLGDVEKTDWCSTSNPQGDCKPYKGICKPMNTRTLAFAKDLQRQLNRLLKARKKSLLYVDGSIGPKTVAAVNKEIPYPAPNCDAVAQIVDELAATASAVADQVGAGVVPDPKGSVARSPVIDPSTGVPKYPPRQAGFGAIVDFVQSPLGLAVVGGGVLFFLMTREDKKKKKPRKKPARKRKTRRKARRRFTYTYY